MRKLIRHVVLTTIFLIGTSAYPADVAEIKVRVMSYLKHIPPEDPKFACILRFIVASYNLKSNGKPQFLVNIDYKNNGVLKEETLVDLPISFNDPSDLDKLKDDLKDELTSRSCNKKDSEKTGSVQYTQDFRNHSNGKVQYVKVSETLSEK